MSATTSGLTKKQVKELKRAFFNAIKENDASGLAALIPRLRESQIGLDTDLQAFHPSGTFDPIQPLYPISIAVFYNALDALRTLIAGGANINIVEKFYKVYEEGTSEEYERLDKDKVFTPLRYAVYFKRDEAARMLLEAGAKYPDYDDYMDDNNNNNEEEDHPVNYYGMVDEIIANLRNPPFLLRTLEYIVQNTERLGVTHDDILGIFKYNIANVGTVKNFMTLFKLIYVAADDKVGTYMSMLPYTYNLANALDFFKFVFENGVDPNTINRDGETALFIFTRPLKIPDYMPREKMEERVTIIKGLIDLGVNPYLPNDFGETPAVRAIKQGLPQPIVDALNVRSLDNIYELRAANPYLVDRIATKFTKGPLRNTPKSYAAMLKRALANDNTRNNARIAFRPANIPNITGRTGKNYQKMKSTQRRRAAEGQRPTAGGGRRRRRTANLKRTRQHTLKATKPL